MHNFAWCKLHLEGMWHGWKIEGYKMFLSGPGEAGESHVICLIQKDMMYVIDKIVRPDDG